MEHEQHYFNRNLVLISPCQSRIISVEVTMEHRRTLKDAQNQRQWKITFNEIQAALNWPQATSVKRQQYKWSTREVNRV